MATVRGEAEANLAGLDQRVSHLATRLQVVSQDTAAQLEQTIEDISRTVPRITYDLQFMRDAGLTLQLNLKSIETKTKRSEDDPTDAALERLHHLSTIKVKMEATREVLREAESWSVLEPEVTNLIATSSYTKASERLAEASKSMVVFQNTPEFESRRALMISLQNQLEAAVSSELVAAINGRDISACRTYFSIFSNIQRESEFRNYYNGSRRADLIALWQVASLSDCNGVPSSTTAPAPLPFSEFFRRFLSDLLSRVNEEQSNITAIFPDPQSSLSLFIQSTLDSLSPSLTQRLAEVSEFHGDTALPELIKSFKVAEEFASSVEQIMGRIGYSSFFSQAGDDSGTGRRPGKRISISSRRMGSRSMSISPNVNILANGNGATWEHALFESFIDLQTEYQLLESRFINKELLRILNSSVSQSSDVSRQLQERSAAVFGTSEECLNRCIVFTHGYGAIGMVEAINLAFKMFLEASQRDLIPPAVGTELGSMKSHLPSPPRVDSEALEELDYTPDDWSNFQLALHLLETCRVIKERLLVFEAKVRASLVQVSTTFRLARNDPHGVHLGGMGATKGEAELLLQSSLNSVELHTLLDALDTGTQSSPSLLVTSPSAVRPTDGAILATSLNGAVSFTKSCQHFLQRVILKPLHAHLSTYAGAPVWASTESRTERGAFDLQIPSFSLSPTQTIQRVAEGLLNLPRLFEVYGDDDALAFSIETLPFVDRESVMYTGAQTGVPPSPSDDRPQLHSRRPSATPPAPPRRISSTSLSVASHPSGSEQAHVPLVTSLTPEIVTSTWLHSLTLSLLTHLTSNVLPSIPQLSQQGAAQLSSDLSYFSNIIRALNVEFEGLDQWREILDVKEVEARSKYDTIRTETRLGGGGDIPGREIWEKVAKMRGWVPGG